MRWRSGRPRFFLPPVFHVEDRIFPMWLPEKCRSLTTSCAARPGLYAFNPSTRAEVAASRLGFGFRDRTVGLARSASTATARAADGAVEASCCCLPCQQRERRAFRHALAQHQFIEHQNPVTASAFHFSAFARWPIAGPRRRQSHPAQTAGY